MSIFVIAGRGQSHRREQERLDMLFRAAVKTCHADQSERHRCNARRVVMMDPAEVRTSRRLQ